MIYFFLTELRNALYDRNILKIQKLPGMTISVGNIEVGGTGKTPTVIAICKKLLEAGKKPVILTRGYKSGLKKNEWAVLKGGKYSIAPSILYADEAMECSVALPTVPVVLGSRRFEAAMKYLELDSENKPTHWVLDDGFQHRKIFRDVDIVLVTPQFSLSPWAVLPCGMQRENGRNIRRADFVFLSKLKDLSEIEKRLNFVQDKIFNLKSKFGQFIQVSGEKTDLKSSPFIRVVTAIARPANFLEIIAVQGIKISAVSNFKDHELIPWSNFSHADDVMITTAKDFHRALPPLNLKIFIATQEISLDPLFLNRAKIFNEPKVITEQP